MELQKLNVKFFVDDRNQVPLTTFIDIFHSWIQATDGIYYDVADYSHMAAGPGIVLVAHEANISVDARGNRLGLLYNHKQPMQGSNYEKLHRIVQAALEYCRRIEEEPSLKGKFKFQGHEVLLLMNDRLLAPNTEETFRAAQPDLEAVGRALFAGADFTLERDRQDPRQRFSLLLKTPRDLNVKILLENLKVAGADAASVVGA